MSVSGISPVLPMQPSLPSAAVKQPSVAEAINEARKEAPKPYPDFVINIGAVSKVGDNLSYENISSKGISFK